MNTPRAQQIHDMANGADFPHLKLVLQNRLRANFGRRLLPVANEVKKNLSDRPAHAKKVRDSINLLRQQINIRNAQRANDGAPSIDAGAGFVIQLPEHTDPETIAHALGLEFVAEGGGGFMFVASHDLNLAKLEEVLTKFEAQEKGGGAAAFVVDVFESPDDPHRIDRLLTPEVRKLWPLIDDQEYIFDLSIQTAEGTRNFTVDPVKQRKAESEDEFRARRNRAREEALVEADEKWSAKAEERFDHLDECIRFYGGVSITGLIANEPATFESVIRFPDSFQIRARVPGRGWRDIFYNSPHLFEVALPDEIQQPLPPNGVPIDAEQPELMNPPPTAPRVCVIDSGIQEGHVWLDGAVEVQKSRCFIPGRDVADTGDWVPNGGHGTRVAGAVLYPDAVPSGGLVEPIAWIQNARVLDETNHLPVNLPPGRYIQQVVDHFLGTTKIFNHSIASNEPCPLTRMTTWAAKIDELSHKNEILFLQAAGNLRSSNARPNNPGIHQHIQAGRLYPDYLREASSRIANPAQSLQALTVGSVCAETWAEGDKRSFTTFPNSPSAFSRGGLGMWDSIKPEVVEIGGDLATTEGHANLPTKEAGTCIELVRATGDGGPAVARDDVGTSFAAPKVANLAARLQLLFPDASPLLWRALIVHSARWPEWFGESGWTADQALQMMGYGIPSPERALENTEYRVTLVTPTAATIRNQELHVYKIVIPEEIRNRPDDVMLRIDVTLSYSSEPRRTRISRRGYMATWLDWRSSGLGEPAETFVARVSSGEDTPARKYKQLEWCLHYSSQHGEAEETHRGNGTIQKDWAQIASHELPEEFLIAVRAHKGWDHREYSGGAKYCLVATIEAENQGVSVYTALAAVNVEVAIEQQTEVEAFI
jgi:hypothetical protein